MVLKYVDTNLMILLIDLNQEYQSTIYELALQYKENVEYIHIASDTIQRIQEALQLHQWQHLKLKKDTKKVESSESEEEEEDLQDSEEEDSQDFDDEKFNNLLHRMQSLRTRGDNKLLNDDERRHQAEILITELMSEFKL